MLKVSRIFKVSIAISSLLPFVLIKAQPLATVVVENREWLRCSFGQTWDGQTCIGEAKEYSFKGAVTAVESFNRRVTDGKKGWRLPTVRELQGLRVCITGFESELLDIKDGHSFIKRWCKQSSNVASIDLILFPRTPRAWFWTSSLYPNRSTEVWGEEVWGVDFEYGFVNGASIDKEVHVRVVR
jgi:Protein of unknown function (DUF1566)